MNKEEIYDNNGIDILLELLSSADLKQQYDDSLALYKMASKAVMLSFVDTIPPSPTPQVYLGEQYVNNSTVRCYFSGSAKRAALCSAKRPALYGAKQTALCGVRWLALCGATSQKFPFFV
ncbi:hypothetical protein ZIOFF_027975 [Zingiber officinale]|uniref:Uncharacterized protein n=1 Tax=Zingiber officinale TaxID=94328 RepID=A0A8J5LDJ4_ZINOF|nr:hypothetical protein ZIOFF_027975 [Zingiber officinale]